MCESPRRSCLGQAGKAAEGHRKALLDGLATSGSPEFKAAALHALTQWGPTRADIDAIVPLIRDRDAEVRIAAWGSTLSGLVDAKAAGAITDERDKSVREMLVAQFQNEPPEIKAAIIEDIGKFKAAVEASITPLVKQIRTGTIEIKAASTARARKGRPTRR